MKYPLISLKAARVNAGLTQKQASKLLGISQSTLQNYESGKNVPDIVMARQLEKLYGFPSDFIFFGVNNA